MGINLLESGAERRHIFHDPNGHPDVRESLAYLLPLPELGMGVIFYTWVHALGENGTGRAGVAGIAYGPAVGETVFEVHDGIGVSDSMSFDDWRVGPATMTLSDDMMGSRIVFTGERLTLDYRWDGLNPAFGYRANRNGCPEWLARDRAEQGARVTGTLRLDGVEHRIDGFGHRDHSWGMRDWGGATHWKWWNVMAGGGTAIHVMELQYFGKTTLHGYVQKDGIIATAVGLDADMTFDERFVHTKVAATVTDDAGRVTEITCRQGADLQWPVSPRLWLHEASMHATVDGAPAVGYIECAWSPEYIAHHRTDGAGAGGRHELTLDRD
ncbi:DUF7064 domain-containing protein [Nocardia jinanensis]|uniref:DUF7064 domain-containing protein n=1 Tax=Nocardia jinanensis TaxID=382504 RepID=A0A917RMK6_9NOCA|nr:hypothetical protein [Nocardia jinanensis]GGL15884.1 hypothetical protein GCM10011588_33190 [Nocardia jinanensis]